MGKFQFPSPTSVWHSSSYPSINPTQPSLSLAGKTVIITGGGAGIGLAMSKSIAQAGAKTLIILGRRTKVLESAGAEIGSQPGNTTKILAISADVAKKDQVDAAFAQIAKLLPGVKPDILVTNAGYFTGPRALGTETAEEWQTTFNINVLGVYLVTMAFIGTAREDATIININSAVATIDPFPGFSSYGATKIATAKLMQYVQFAYPKLHTVVLHRGQVAETEMSAKAHEAFKDLQNHIDDAQLAGDFTVWVASEEARFLKGKFVWVNWDVEELKAKKEEIEKTQLLSVGLEGFSKFEF